MSRFLKVISFLRNLPGNVLIGLVFLYRRCISPLKPKCCRFVPSCSEYAIEAIKMHGAWRGTVLALWRILRCNPFWHGDMYDPVPKNFAGSCAVNAKFKN